MQTYNKYLTSYFKNLLPKQEKYKKIFFDPEKQNYFITNIYSFIRLNTNNKKDYQKINYIKNNYGINDDVSIITQLRQYNDTFNSLNHCNFVDINKLEVKKDLFREKIVSINNRDFKIKEINKIKRVLGGKIAIYYSDKSNDTISIVSKNGYAFLLGCITY